MSTPTINTTLTIIYEKGTIKNKVSFSSTLIKSSNSKFIIKAYAFIFWFLLSSSVISRQTSITKSIISYDEMFTSVEAKAINYKYHHSIENSVNAIKQVNDNNNRKKKRKKKRKKEILFQRIST